MAGNASASRPLPAELVAALGEPGGGGLAVLLGPEPSPVVERLRSLAGHRTVHELEAAADRSVLHAELAAAGPFRAIVVDAPNTGSRPALFRNVFLHLEPGGVLWFATLREAGGSPDTRPGDVHLIPYLAKLVGARGLDPEGADWRRRDEILMSRAVGRVVVDEDQILVVNRDACFAKLREDELNRVLARRPDLGAVLETRPAVSFRSRATIRHNVTPYEAHHEVFEVPQLSLRSYADVVCRPGGVAVTEQLILPETYRHSLQERLWQQQAPNRSHFFADLAPMPAPRRLPGEYFYLDSEFPGHFGHFVSEVVSRFWGWAPAKRRFPNLKALVSFPEGASALPGFCLQIFAAVGIDPADVVGFAADETVVVDQLIGVTPMLSMPEYVHPDLAEAWAGLRRHLTGERPPGDPRAGKGRTWIDKTLQIDRIFVRRPDESIRICHNEAEVVARFTAAGFTPVRPETLSLSKQAALFAGASVVAGFVGSAMLGLIYCPEPVRVILVGPESYTSNNEYLIASVLGHEIDHIASKPEIPHPPGGWSFDAFYSDYTFDFDAEGRDLDEVLAGLPRPRLSDRLRAASATRNTPPR